MNAQPTILLVDISNTRTKFLRMSPSGFLPELRMLPTADMAPSSLLTLLQSWSYAAACVSSVVPEKARMLAEALSVPVHFISAQDVAGVDFSTYAGAATLGADRVANAVAAAQYGKFPVVAIDLGTASTFDVLTLHQGKPSFIGGAIAPGLAYLQQFFHTSTAQLPAVALTNSPRAIGQNTGEAMQSGMLLGYRGLLREIVAGIESELGEEVTALATGGDAAFMASLMPDFMRHCPQLTFEGLAYIAKLVFSSLLVQNPS